MVDTSATLRRSVPSDALAVGLPRVHAGTLHSTATAAFIRCREAKSEAEDLCRLREFRTGASVAVGDRPADQSSHPPPASANLPRRAGRARRLSMQRRSPSTGPDRPLVDRTSARPAEL